MVSNPYRYAGYQYDEETDLYYLNARYYDAKIARFLTEDTYKGRQNDPLSLNLYTYCHNEPVMYRDPSGHEEYNDRYIDTKTEAGAKAMAILNAATEEWGRLNRGLSQYTKGSEQYNKLKAQRDLQHEIAENAREEYAFVSGDAKYNEIKYGKIVTNQIDTSQKTTSDPLSNIIITRLSEEGFVTIIGDGISYYGGNQAWYSRNTQVAGGYGPVAAANILAYMALTDPDLRKLYSGKLNEITKDEFTEFMEEIYKYVKPSEIPILNLIYDNDDKSKLIPTLGVIAVWSMMEGVQMYADRKNVSLNSITFDEAPTFENYVSFVRNGLKGNNPVALLNLHYNVAMNYTNPKTGKEEEQDFNYHWVTITGMVENTKTGEVELEVSTWGGRATLSFNELYAQWQKNSLLDLSTVPGMIYFDAK